MRNKSQFLTHIHESSAFVPRPNPNLSELRVLALGGIHSAAQTAFGNVFTWGNGGFGAIGHYVYHRELLPRQVNGPWEGKISHIATSGVHTAAITYSGEFTLGVTMKVMVGWGLEVGVVQVKLAFSVFLPRRMRCLFQLLL